MRLLCTLRTCSSWYWSHASPSRARSFRIVGLLMPVMRVVALTPTPSTRAETTWTRSAVERRFMPSFYYVPCKYQGRICVTFKERIDTYVRGAYRVGMDTPETGGISKVASKGGKARAASLTPEERSEAARRAVEARWEREG